MRNEDLFKEAQERCAQKQKGVREQSRIQQENAQEETIRLTKNAERIDAFLKLTMESLKPDIEDAKKQGYEVKHHASNNSTINPKGIHPFVSALTSYMQKGSIAHQLGNIQQPYKADHLLNWRGNEQSGEIVITYNSLCSGASEELEHFCVEALPNAKAIHTVFRKFIASALSDELKRH